jgi:hypothetical protein
MLFNDIMGELGMGLADREHRKRRSNNSKSNDKHKTKRKFKTQGTNQKNPHNNRNRTKRKNSNDFLKIIPIVSVLLAYILITLDNKTNFVEIIITLLILITIWTGYKYWLLKYYVIRKNKTLVTRFLIVTSLLIASRHFPMTSPVGVVFDYVIFALLLYVTLTFTWIMLKVINSLDLRSDLLCWGLILTSIILFCGGIFLIFTIWLSIAFSGVSMFQYSLLIMGGCITVLGIFSAFRARRRYGTFVYFS